ncbi:MAG: ribosome-associated translation inhibitor RaiA [Planctomycetota bacterium]|nr:MAG: ribosome-associated translation inhibitor RaiA [Planctomycetota bacterium]
MTESLHVAFHGLPPSEQARERVRKQLAALERHAPKILSCRVTVQADRHRRRSGNTYEVHAELHVPGRTFSSGRHRPGDERYADLDFAIREAFRRLKRQLDEHSARRREARRASVGARQA